MKEIISWMRRLAWWGLYVILWASILIIISLFIRVIQMPDINDDIISMKIATTAISLVLIYLSSCIISDMHDDDD